MAGIGEINLTLRGFMKAFQGVGLKPDHLP
jgi:hypothetical protein